MPIAAPSANKSGKPSPTTAVHVLADLDGRIAGIVDGGATGVGVESTVVDCTTDIPIILRPGGVSKEEIEAVVGKGRYRCCTYQHGEKAKIPRNEIHTLCAYSAYVFDEWGAAIDSEVD